MVGIIQNGTCPTGLATAGELSASLQNEEPVCFSIRWFCPVIVVFTALYLEGLFGSAKVSGLKPSQFNDDIKSVRVSFPTGC